MKSESLRFRPSFLLVGVGLSLVFLLFLHPYSGGYGTIVDGELSVQRRPLYEVLIADYGRDGGEWSFGYFVPIAVCALFWIRREEFLALGISPANLSGALVLCLGFLVYWAGFRGEQKYFGYASGQILIMGTILWFLGWRWFKNLFWLWVLLGMMWPWRFLIGRISAPLQLAMVKVTSAFMNFIGVDAVASGSALSTASKDPVTSLPISLEVDVACSGMRSLFALVMIGLIYAFMRVNNEWKRWVLMACVPIVAICGNFVRLLMLYFGSLMWGTEIAIGRNHEMSAFHLLAGIMVFIVALILMTGLVSILNGGWRKVFKKTKTVSRTVIN